MSTKVVFDSNIYLSAVAAPGAYSRSWLQAARRPGRTFDVYISMPLIDEVKEKLLNKFRLPVELADEFISEIFDTTNLVKPTEDISVLQRDPDDNKVLECALAAGALIVISADKDLLQLRGFRDIVVYHPNNLKYLFPQDFTRAI